jgi:flagellar basal-body rod modification protein FlgD
MATSGVTANTGTSSGSTSLSSASASATQVTEQQFLQLLVAQLQNQDPLNPMDGTQFVSQLAQFSELEQMIGVNQGVQQLVTDASGSSSSSSSSSSSGSSGSSSASDSPIHTKVP